MRSAIIGARFAGNNGLLYEFVKASTELTHTDPKALTGALAVSHAAIFAISNPNDSVPETKEFFEILHSLSNKDDKEWQSIVQIIETSLRDNLSISEFVSKMNLNNGVTGYIYHTVPVAIYSWLRHYGDFKATLIEVLNCGGDTDTVGAITGALAGTTVGEEGIPKDWINGIIEWPRTTTILRKAADTITVQNTEKVAMIRYFWPGIIIRNIFQLIVVLGHVALRFIPVKIRSSIGI
jgi:ADP-ribosylglycohydrolase